MNDSLNKLNFEMKKIKMVLGVLKVLKKAKIDKYSFFKYLVLAYVLVTLYILLIK